MLDKFNYPSRTSTAAPLKFGNRWIIWFNIILDRITSPCSDRTIFHVIKTASGQQCTSWTRHCEKISMYTWIQFINVFQYISIKFAMLISISPQEFHICNTKCMWPALGSLIEHICITRLNNWREVSGNIIKSDISRNLRSRECTYCYKIPNVSTQLESNYLYTR